MYMINIRDRQGKRLAKKSTMGVPNIGDQVYVGDQTFTVGKRAWDMSENSEGQTVDLEVWQ